MLKHKSISLLCGVVFIVLFTLSFYFNVNTGFLVLFLFWLGITTWGVFDIRSQYFVKTFCNNALEKNKVIALSFDDGPHEMTEKVLDVLQKHNVKAAFFCIGSQIEKYPEIFMRIVNEGHIIGNHSYSHSNLFGIFSSKKVTEELVKTRLLIEEYSGKKALYFRPPFGVTNPRISRAIRGSNHKAIGWNIRSLDTVIKSETKVLNRIKKKIVPGGIILLHDTSLKSVNVLERLLLFLQEEDYKIVTIDQIINEPAYAN
jgi:peptidoglycan-N-acetylglucosamine deacetylase